MDLLDSMKVYVLTVEKGSLSGAAATLGVSATMAGKHLRSLEARLGMQLLNRTTRRQHLTSFGEDYYTRCKEILRLVAETDAQAQHQKLAPAGKLRITAPVIFGTHALMPALAIYMARYPEIALDVVLSDRVVDLAEEGFDAAIRIGELPENAPLVARPLTPYSLTMCASPGYLAHQGIPETVEDLQHHECLSFSPTALSYWLGTGEDVRRRSVSGRLQINNGQALRIAALNGMGIVLQSTLLLEEDIQAGRLIQLFPEQGLPSRPMSVVYLPDRYHSTKLRSFVAFLMEHFPPMARV
ncbi:LysR family transcriptional regulator [Stenotrophomonas sp. GD03993]|uniref:LysR family transcriptional regulator n=1 Tax=unclassified Stenotrophomonas TaxID=196198 RepID=UPI0024495F8C|nr:MULTISPECIES: LysR family transcriptional regulator [unclassified Stenotrophomonas]MDH0463682.1 LysR family transcriptional regulator [Stenotrophomonas sp. GD03993]MDH0877465.1 LysR family transcriptional regulator [Stenotrophomonas sp. GD03877]MDH2154922.1 LysR family transcriptional regulator [Stenotrophomonas sp. GD03657]